MSNLLQINIKRILKEKNMTQVELARRTQMKPININQIIKGTYGTYNNPSWRVMCKLADALEVSLDEFRKE